MRRAAKTDDNQAEIVAALRKVGASVQDLSAVGKGCPDLLVGFRMRNYAIEVKDGAKPPSRRKLTADQVAWRATWNGHYAVVDSVQKALAAIGA